MTPVLNPNEEAQAVEKPYPDRLETVHIDHRYGAQLATLFLMIPLAAVLICDFAISRRITWSSYVLGAGVCICLWVILPFFLDVRKPYLYIAVDILSASAYLGLIAWRMQGLDWYSFVALPLTFLAGLGAILCVYLARRKKMPALHRVTSMVWVVAGFLVGLEALIDRYAWGVVHLQWSIYTLISLLAFGTIFLVIEKNPRLKADIRRRLYL